MTELAERLETDDDADVRDIVSRLDQLESRSGNEVETRFSKFSRYAGLVALILSLLIGGLELYDRTVRQAENERQENRDRVAKISEGLDRLRMEQAYLSNLNNPTQSMMRGPQINGERLRLLQSLDELSESVLPEMKSVELTQFGSEYMMVQRYDQAVNFLNKAEDRAKTPQVKQEAQRYLAQSLFPPSPSQDVGRARKILADLIVRVQQTGAPANAMHLGMLEDGWLRGEALAGHCGEANVHFNKLLNHWDETNAQMAPQNLSSNIPINRSLVRDNYQRMTGCEFN